MQVGPIKPTLKPPGTKCLKLKCDVLLSTSAFKLRRYTAPPTPDAVYNVEGRGLHSSTFHLNLSRFRHQIHPKHPPLSLSNPCIPSVHPLNNP